jgi:glycosyltransferase involved in cell wall biosynthesis
MASRTEETAFTISPVPGPAGPDWDRIQLLVAAPEIPEAERQAGSRHLFQEIALFKKLGADATVICENDGESHDRLVLEQLGVPVFSVTELPTLLDGIDFDVALIAFWNLAERCIPVIRERSPGTAILIDSIDLHFIRRVREELHGGPSQDLQQGDAVLGAELRRELNAYASADLVLTVSQKEANVVNDLLTNPTQAMWVPLWEEFPMSSIPFDRRRGILFIGNFRHPPNGQALEWLCSDILPRVDPAALERHPVIVVGNALEGELLDLCVDTPGVEPVGFVPSLLPYFDYARLFIAPLLTGAGTKRKLIQAAMVGVPTVATSIATEGLDIVDGEGVLIADDAATFADRISSHLEDRDRWTGIAQLGRERIIRSNGPETARRQLTEAVRTALRRSGRPAA